MAGDNDAYERLAERIGAPGYVTYIRLLENQLTPEEAEFRYEDIYWFRVGEIFDIEKDYEVDSFLSKHRLLSMGKERSQFAKETLSKLHSIVHKERVINYYLEKDSKLDKVLNIYIRVNSAGTILSYSNLLLSIDTAQWQEKDAREEIIRFIDEADFRTVPFAKSNSEIVGAVSSVVN